jgi:hypothetical protein
MRAALPLPEFAACPACAGSADRADCEHAVRKRRLQRRPVFACGGVDGRLRMRQRARGKVLRVGARCVGCRKPQRRCLRPGRQRRWSTISRGAFFTPRSPSAGSHASATTPARRSPPRRCTSTLKPCSVCPRSTVRTAERSARGSGGLRPLRHWDQQHVSSAPTSAGETMSAAAAPACADREAAAMCAKSSGGTSVEMLWRGAGQHQM